MTNQLTHTDNPTALADREPTRTITSADTSDERPKPPSGGRGWILIASGAALAVGAVGAVGAVVGLAGSGNDPAEPAEPDAQQRPAYVVVQDEIDAALAERSVAGDVGRPAYVVVQDEIDAALAERSVVTSRGGG